MKVSINWLRDYVDVDLSPQELAEKLTMIGLEVKTISETKDKKDVILDIEITPNRPDCLSVLGIAREIGTITKGKLKRKRKKIKNKKLKSKTEIKIEIQDKKGCLKYTGKLIENIKIKPSPEWMQERLFNLGLRPINNVVDITNYIMLEYGQPLHAFDFDKIKSMRVIAHSAKDETCQERQSSIVKKTKKITIRKAKAGEKIITLDNEEKKLNEQILIIADSQKPLAIAGVIGGKGSEVDENTRRIFLESAYFEPAGIRKTSRKLAISTESSYRFERGVSLEGVGLASERAVELLEELAEGKLEEVVQTVEKKRKEKKINLRCGQIQRILGINIPQEKINRILRDLEFEIISQNRESIKIKVPYFRSDVFNESDLIEEIARIFGYENIPIAMPKIEISYFNEDKIKLVSKRVKKVLISSGFKEVITNSLISKQSLAKEDKENERIISIVNPLSAEQEIMRPNLFFNALDILAWNFKHKIEAAKIFELGRVYYKNKKKDVCEDKNLLLAMFGKDRKLDFYSLKGAVEKLLLSLGISNYTFEKNKSSLFSKYAACLKVDKRKIAILGKVNRNILTYYGLEEKNVYICEIAFKELINLVDFQKKFKPISKYPAVQRDIALLLKNDIACEKIVSLIRAAGGELITNISLFDIYEGEQVPLGYKSLAFSIEYQTNKKTLTDEEINTIDAEIRQQLFIKLGARGR